MRNMVTKLRACMWALSFGVQFHIAMDEHHSVLAAICIGAFWTAVVDVIVSGAVGTTRA
jgi:hypothetical protein